MSMLTLFQCAIPAFAGLFPEPHNTNILKLLFVLAEWQFLAKLTVHTETTLDALSATTKDLGKRLQHFKNHTCRAYTCKESTTEFEKRRRAAQLQRKDLSTTSIERCTKTFNLNFIKLHALGDYVSQIRLFGTVDNYTTQVVSDSTLPISF